MRFDPNTSNSGWPYNFVVNSTVQYSLRIFGSKSVGGVFDQNLFGCSLAGLSTTAQQACDLWRQSGVGSTGNSYSDSGYDVRFLSMPGQVVSIRFRTSVFPAAFRVMYDYGGIGLGRNMGSNGVVYSISKVPGDLSANAACSPQTEFDPALGFTGGAGGYVNNDPAFVAPNKCKLSTGSVYYLNILDAKATVIEAMVLEFKATPYP